MPVCIEEFEVDSNSNPETNSASSDRSPIKIMITRQVILGVEEEDGDEFDTGS